MIIKRVHSCGLDFLVFHVLPLFFSQQIIVYQPRGFLFNFLSSLSLFYARRIYITDTHTHTQKHTRARYFLHFRTTSLSVLTALFSLSRGRSPFCVQASCLDPACISFTINPPSLSIYYIVFLLVFSYLDSSYIHFFPNSNHVAISPSAVIEF